MKLTWIIKPSLRLAHDIARHFHLPIEQVFIFDDEADGKKDEGI